MAGVIDVWVEDDESFETVVIVPLLHWHWHLMHPEALAAMQEKVLLADFAVDVFSAAVVVRDIAVVVLADGLEAMVVA